MYIFPSPLGLSISEVYFWSGSGLSFIMASISISKISASSLSSLLEFASKAQWRESLEDI